MSKYRLKKSILTWLLTLAVMMSVVGTNFIPAQAETNTVEESVNLPAYKAYLNSGNYLLDYWNIDPNATSGYDTRTILPLQSDFELFLYHPEGTNDYDTAGYRQYYLGAWDAENGKARNAVCSSSHSISSAHYKLLVYEYFSYYKSNGNLVRHDVVGPCSYGTDEKCICSSLKSKATYTNFNVYSESDYLWTGKVFNSLLAAELYYLTGDDSGLIRVPDDPFNPGNNGDDDISDGDVSDGDVSDGDPSEGGGSSFDFGTLKNILEEVVGNPLKQIKNVAQSIAEHASNMRDKLSEIGDYIKNQLPAKMRDAFSSFFESISNSLDSIGEKISALGTSIVDGIGSKLEELFVPDLDDLDGHIATIRTKLGFIDDIHETADYIFDFLSELGTGTPPVIKVNLGASTKRDIGQMEVVIDFSWYEPYKPMVDKLLAAFIYVTFIWNMYRRLPEIIQGHGMVISGMSSMIDHYTPRNSSTAPADDWEVTPYRTPGFGSSGYWDAFDSSQRKWF